MGVIRTHRHIPIRCHCVLLGVLCVLALRVPAGAEPPGPGAIPSDAIVWWHFDPSSFADKPNEPIRAQREILLATLRAALASGALGNRTSAMLGSLLLVGLEAGDSPHTTALLDFDAGRPPTGTGMDLRSLQVVMQVESGARHAELLRTVRAIAIDTFSQTPVPDATNPGVQARIELPGGRVGVAFRRDEWEEWREVSWCATSDAFTFGIGRSTLSRWFAHEDAEHLPDAPVWGPLFASIDAARPPGPIVFECYVDFDALRRRFPEAFHTGRTPRMLDALHLRTASQLVFQARIVRTMLPDGRAIPLIALDAGIREHDGSIARVSLSHDAWPEAVASALVPTGATSVMVSTVDWKSAFELVLKLHAATIPDRQLRKFEASRDQWLGTNRAKLDVLLADLNPALIIASHDALPAPLPGVGCVLVPGHAGVTPGRIGARMETLFESFRPAVRTDLNEASPVWSLRVDRAGLVRLPWWTLVRGPDGPAVLVGAWAAGPLEAARRWLGGEARP